MRQAARRGRASRACAAAGVMLAGLLAAGCARGAAGPPPPSVESCAEFGISAIKHHVTVTSLPAACRGLTRAQVNLAVGQALYAMTSNVHGKAERRARAAELSPLLGRLVTTVPAQRGPLPPAATGGGRTSSAAVGFAALISWLITVGLGSWMMARWITRGGFRRARLSKAGLPPSLIFTHFGLAVAGLLVWGAYLATGQAAAAWAACALLLPVAGLGMALVTLWLPERSLTAATVPAATVPAGPAVPAGTAAGTGAVPGANAAASAAGPGPPAPRHPPALIVAAHGVFAVATILFALLAAVGSR
jgi:manganese efflux pump family protein